MASKITDWEKCRARIEHEDTLLNSRTNIFLVVNGLGAVAVGLEITELPKEIITSVVFLANCFWLISAHQTTIVLKDLTTEYIDHANDPIDALVRNSLKFWPRWMRNTSIVGRYIPLVVTLGWIVGAVMSAS